MKVLYCAVIILLFFLATSSGVTKILLFQADIEFFGEYGFTQPILIAYGTSQLLGGVLLIAKNTRAIGSLVVAISFLISAILLGMSGNVPFTIVTLIFVALLGFVFIRSLNIQQNSK